VTCTHAISGTVRSWDDSKVHGRVTVVNDKQKVRLVGKYAYWLFWCAAAVAVDYYVVYSFITAGLPPSFGPEFPIQGSYPNIPPSVPITWLAVIGFFLATTYIWLAFARRGWILKKLFLILIVVWLVFSFSRIYYEDGNEPGVLYNDYPAFGHQLSKNEALYFTVGILTTAGTGDLSPKTDSARTAVTVQMTLDVLVLVIGVAGVVRESRLTADRS
jgi:hypothetical protein